MFNSEETFGFPAQSWITCPDLSHRLQYEAADPARTVAFGCGEISFCAQWLVLLSYVAKQLGGGTIIVWVGNENAVFMIICWCFFLFSDMGS